MRDLPEPFGHAAEVHDVDGVQARQVLKIVGDRGQCLERDRPGAFNSDVYIGAVPRPAFCPRAKEEDAICNIRDMRPDYPRCHLLYVFDMQRGCLHKASIAHSVRQRFRAERRAWYALDHEPEIDMVIRQVEEVFHVELRLELL